MTTRRQFLKMSATAVGLAAVSLRGREAAADKTPTWQTTVPDFPEHDPQITTSWVKRFVIAAHVDLAAVKEMLAARPDLINATWDWGKGDFETALGGASHMGRRDIATHLLEHNARLDIFAAASLGLVEVVRAALITQPALVNVPGPHGISLLAHAEHGKAADVVELLRKIRAQ